MRAAGHRADNQLHEITRVLVCGASSERVGEMTRFLAAFEYQAIPVRSAERALEAAHAQQPQIAIWLETEVTARRGINIAAAQSLREVSPGAESIVIGPADQPDHAAQAFHAGVYNCMSWPVDYANLARDLEFLEMEARRRRELWMWSGGEREVTFEGLTGGSRRMVELYEHLRRLALNHDPVLITGPVGSGKELVASALNALMEKAAQGQPYHPLMIYRCCGLTDEKTEELFSAQGILGALSVSAGEHAAAQSHSPDVGNPSAVELLGFTRPGVLLIDEISDLPANAQQKLAAWLIVNKAVLRAHPVRIVASSRCDLALLAERGKFHPGLLRLLQNQAITVPALAERTADIPMLVESFLSGQPRQQTDVDQLGRAPELSRDAQRALLRHHWPGNVRELKNAVTRAAMLSRNRLIQAEDLGLAAPATPPPQVLDWHVAERPNGSVWLN